MKDNLKKSLQFFRLRVVLYGFMLGIIIGINEFMVPSNYRVPVSKPVTNTISAFGALVLSAYDYQPEHSIQYTAWIPEWDYEAGVSAFLSHATSFSQVNPVWFHVEEGGKIKTNNHTSDQELKALTKKYHIKLIPTIQSFDADYLHAALRDTESTKNHAQTILNLVEIHNADGIDLDYEMTYLTDKEMFYILLKLLSEELHSKGKLLTIDVMSKTSDETESYNSFVETRQVQDWSMLAKYVDEIRIMVYDYDNSNPKGSPINPYPWVEKVVAYALTKAPAEKFILGTPLYAYSWKNGELYKSYTYEVVKEGIDKRNALPVFDEEVKEWRVELADDDGTQVVWYQDAKSVEHRLNLVKQHGLGGLIFWRLGGEDRGIYSLLH